MTLKPQDILVLLKLMVKGDAKWTFNQLALELAMSPAEVHAASKRLLSAQLVVKTVEAFKPNFRNTEEFLFHGIQYVFVPELGGLTRGIPTSVGAPVLSKKFHGDELVAPVWPDSEGSVRGEAFSPLYASVPTAAKNDEVLYELLALVDAIRGGRAREREIAKSELKRRFEKYEKGK